MAFVPEDGNGLSNANSLVSVAYADAYFADRGITDWAGTDALKQNWLILATDYIEIRFGKLFQYKVFSPTQALSFPRVDCSGVKLFPEDIKKACCEYALRAKNGPLAPDPEVDPSGQAVVRTSEKVGPIEESKSFSQWSNASSIMKWRPYPLADSMISKYLKPSGAGRVIH